LISGILPLTPIQYWFFEKDLILKDHFNQSMFLLSRINLKLCILKRVFSRLVAHHDVLRCKYNNDSGEWIQTCENSTEINICSYVDLTLLNQEERERKQIEHVNNIQSSFCLKTPPLIKAILFEHPNEQILFITIHHLLVDAVSWKIILEDIESLYNQFLISGNANLGVKTHSYKQWSTILKECATSEKLAQELDYWKGVIKNKHNIFDIKNSEEANWKKIHDIKSVISRDETDHLLKKTLKLFNAEINDILLTLLTLAIGDWNGKYKATIFLEGHGREEIKEGLDLSRTVGWFTSIFPVNLNIQCPDQLTESIREIKKILKGIPNKGIGYAVLLFLNMERILSISNVGISFNYLGQLDGFNKKNSIFHIKDEPIQFSTDKRNKRFCPLEINAAIVDKQLCIDWVYDERICTKKSISAIADNFITRFKKLIKTTKLSEEGLSKFDLLDMDEIMEINNIMKKQ
jgi:non-ribosomal peptide synthase protein (TIGR01720 family)